MEKLDIIHENNDIACSNSNDSAESFNMDKNTNTEEIKDEPFHEAEEFENETSTLTEIGPEKIEIKIEPSEEVEDIIQENTEIENEKCMEKTCFVEGCLNSSENTNKEFIKVPLKSTIRLKWYKAVNKTENPSKEELFCCEDHFDMPNDLKNYTFRQIFGSKLGKNILPHIYAKQDSEKLEVKNCKSKFEATELNSVSNPTSKSDSNSVEINYKKGIKDNKGNESVKLESNTEIGNIKSEDIDIVECKIEDNQGTHFLLNSEISVKPENSEVTQEIPNIVKRRYWQRQNNLFHVNVKYCFIKECKNNSYKNSNKLFLTVPLKPEIRRKWFQAVNLTTSLTRTKNLFCCEDHFDLQNDAKNWMFYKMFGKVLSIKEHIVPHIFSTESNSNSQLSDQDRATKRKFVEDFKQKKSIEVIKKPKNKKRKKVLQTSDSDDFGAEKNKKVIVHLKGQNDDKTQKMEFDKNLQKKFLEDFDKNVGEGKKSYVTTTPTPSNLLEVSDYSLETSVVEPNKKVLIHVKKGRQVKSQFLRNPAKNKVKKNKKNVSLLKNKKKTDNSEFLRNSAKNESENKDLSTNSDQNETIIPTRINIHLEPDLPELILIRDKQQIEKHKPLLLRRKSTVKKVQEVVWVNPPLVEVSNDIIDLDQQDSNENLSDKLETVKNAGIIVNGSHNFSKTPEFVGIKSEQLDIDECRFEDNYSHSTKQTTNILESILLNSRVPVQPDIVMEQSSNISKHIIIDSGIPVQPEMVMNMHQTFLNEIETSTTQEIEIKQEPDNEAEDFEFVNMDTKSDQSFFCEDPFKVSGTNIFVVNQTEESILS